MKYLILIIFGTRPEAIKLAPLILALKKEKAFRILTCITAQHRQMLDQVLAFFKIVPDIDLDIMRQDQTLESLTSSTLTSLTKILQRVAPDLVIVQGDTTTVFTAALASYYQKIPVVHVEAGLRTNDPYAPFPEEINRQLVSRIAAFNFAPTQSAVSNLLEEGISRKTIFKTGNTVVDALNLGLSTINADRKRYAELKNWLAKSVLSGEKYKRLILITGHRRESFGKGFEEICNAIKELSRLFPEHAFIYPVHLNPHVQKPVYKQLGKVPNVILIEPVSYPQMLFLMSKSHLILTDSGGIQEEAPSLRIPVLVMRDKTERPEGVAMGCCRLVGNSRKKIVAAAKKIIYSPSEYRLMQRGKNPYGDGKASERIVSVIKKVLLQRSH